MKKNVVFKFKDGITITCLDSDNKSFAQVKREACKVHDQMIKQNMKAKDALSLTEFEKNPNTKVQFYVTKDIMEDLNLTYNELKKLMNEAGFKPAADTTIDSYQKDRDTGEFIITTTYNKLKDFIENDLDLFINNLADNISKYTLTIEGDIDIKDLPLEERIKIREDYLNSLSEKNKNSNRYNKDLKELNKWKEELEMQKSNTSDSCRTRSKLRKLSKDSTTTRKFNINNATHAVRTIKTLIKNNDEKALKKEFFHLKRDIKADLDHEDYQDMYTAPQLREIVKEYNNLLDAFETCGIDSIESEIADLRNDVNTIKNDVFNVKDSKRVGDVPFEDPTVTISTDFRFSPTNISHYSRHKDRDALLLYYPDIIEDLEEDLADPERVRKFRKDELRNVIVTYRSVAKDYRRAELFEQAEEIESMTDELAKDVWHLEV